MAVLLRTVLSPSLSKWPFLARTRQVTGFIFTSLPTTTTTKATAPGIQDLLTNVQLRCLNQNFIPKRNFYSYFKRKKTPEELRDADKIEPHYELVYCANSVLYIQLSYGGVQAAAGVACLTLTALLCGAPVAVLPLLLEEQLEVAVFAVVNSLICLGILRLSFLYPFRIYYSEIEDQFTAVFVGLHPLAVRHVKILPGEVKPKVPGPVAAVLAPWSRLLYSARPQTIHLNPEHFIYPYYYNKMLGYEREF